MQWKWSLILLQNFILDNSLIKISKPLNGINKISALDNDLLSGQMV